MSERSLRLVPPIEPLPAAAAPLAVDMDGTLLCTDVLMEGIAAGFAAKPLSTLCALPLALLGRARLKRRIAELTPDLDVETLPVNDALLARLEGERANGRSLHLVTAADRLVAERVAARFGLFDSIEASDGRLNLKGSRKLAALKARFPDGFAYAGDSRADLQVWREAQGAVFAGWKRDVAARLQASGVPVEAAFETEGPGWRAWRKALRLHQWSKNLLLFAPLMLAHLYFEPRAWIIAGLAFLLMGLTASGTYLVNDLTDLAADRRQDTKRKRPFAAGVLPVAHGLAAAPALILAGLAGGFALSQAFGVMLCCYVGLTLAYSFALKRAALIDVFALGGLYTLRLVMGAFALGVPITEWLLTFAYFFFFSLSLAKRQGELVRALAQGRPRPPGRGYAATDAPLTLTFGVASAAASILILVLYLVQTAFPSGAYPQPEWMWAAPLFVSLWVMRIWLLAHRGELHDDPVSFAVRDPTSLGLGALLAMAFVFATL